MDASEQWIAKQIEKLLVSVAECIARGEVPAFMITSRLKWHTVRFDGRTLIADPVSRTKPVKLNKHVRRFTSIMWLLNRVLDLLRRNEWVNKRSLVYENETLLQTVSYLDGIVTDLCSLLEVPRWKLRIKATSKGLVAGDLKYRDADGRLIECSSERGTNVPNQPMLLTDVQSNARFILVVEKDTVFDKLIQQGFAFTYAPCIILTGKGNPDFNTRMLLRRLVSDLHVPALALTDANVYGYEIYLSYKFGSCTSAYEAAEIAVPELIRIGVTADDIRDLIGAAPHFRRCRQSQPTTSALEESIHQAANYHEDNRMSEVERVRLRKMLNERPYFAPSTRWLLPRYAFWLHRRYRPNNDCCFYCLGLCSHCCQEFVADDAVQTRGDHSEMLQTASQRNLPTSQELNGVSGYQHVQAVVRESSGCGFVHASVITRRQEATFVKYNKVMRERMPEDVELYKCELQRLHDYDKTAQIEALLSLGQNFLIDSYLRAKLGYHIPELLES